jgi:hypothetical protein
MPLTPTSSASADIDSMGVTLLIIDPSRSKTNPQALLRIPKVAFAQR